MTIDFTQPVLSMPDGSYVVTTKDPMYPYNVLENDHGAKDPSVSRAIWKSIQEWLRAGNKAEPYVPPWPVKIDPEMQLRMEIAAEIAEEQIAEKARSAKWVARKKQLVDEAKKGRA